jgi:hypothetical protein
MRIASLPNGMKNFFLFILFYICINTWDSGFAPQLLKKWNGSLILIPLGPQVGSY